MPALLESELIVPSSGLVCAQVRRSSRYGRDTKNGVIISRRRVVSDNYPQKKNGAYFGGAYASILQLATIIQQITMTSSWAFTRIWDSWVQFYKELNPATLTGAVDVIVVEQPDGELRCSPFHIRFGKMGVLRSKEKVVEMTVNDVSVPIQMILSDGGEAFFVESVERVEEMTGFASPAVTGNKKHVELSKKHDTSNVFFPADQCDSVSADDTYTAVPADTTSVDDADTCRPCDTMIIDDICHPYDRNSVDEARTAQEFTEVDRLSFPPCRGCVHMEDARKTVDGLAMSLCGDLDEDGGMVDEVQFNNHLVAYDQFDSDTDLLSNPDLVIRINGRYYSWRVAGPMLLSLIAFDKSLSGSAIDKLINRQQPKTHDARDLTRKTANNTGPAASSSSVGSYFWWRRATSADPPSKIQTTASPNETTQDDQHPGDAIPESPMAFRPETAKSDSHLDNEDRFLFDDRGALSDSELEEARKTCLRTRYKTTLTLTSDQLKSLNLQRGVPNKACFSVTTKYQGTCLCECEIWLWRYTDKIIVSDIDGTITKSDVLGHIIPRVGVGHWAHIGVAELFNRIAANDYKILYLTARAIGLAGQTKEYLKSVQQDKYFLPGGPLLLSPTSVFDALHREIIEKKPEIFKTGCLQEIAQLFPNNPFFGGFGNRPNDVIAYEASGIPSSRIYIIDPTGRVEFVEKRLEFSYQRISNLVDHLFPPLDKSCAEKDAPVVPIEYNSPQFWRPTIPDVEVDLGRFPKPVTPKGRSTARSSSTSSWAKKK